MITKLFQSSNICQNFGLLNILNNCAPNLSNGKMSPDIRNLSQRKQFKYSELSNFSHFLIVWNGYTSQVAGQSTCNRQLAQSTNISAIKFSTLQN